eukprot:6425996-Amphidinium_carterae.2
MRVCMGPVTLLDVPCFDPILTTDTLISGRRAKLDLELADRQGPVSKERCIAHPETIKSRLKSRTTCEETHKGAKNSSNSTNTDHNNLPMRASVEMSIALVLLRCSDASNGPFYLKLRLSLVPGGLCFGVVCGGLWQAVVLASLADLNATLLRRSVSTTAAYCGASMDPLKTDGLEPLRCCHSTVLA